MEGEKIRILLIEDNPGDARLIRELLSTKEGASFDLEHTDRLSTGLARLAQGNIDVILLDLSLPDSHGLEGLNKICAQAPKVPIVVLSGLSDEAVAINAVQEGAQDYLVKGSVDSALLVRSLRYAIERQRLRVALRENESRYRLLADNAADVIWTANMKWKITYVSPSIKRLLGYTVEEMMRLAITDILTPDSLNQAGKLIRNQMDIMTPGSQYPSLSLTLEYVRKDGSTLWAEVMLSFLWDKDEKLSEVLGVTREITERKKAEEALRQSEQRYRLIAENVQDVIWTVDMNLRPTYTSPSITQLTGYRPEEYITKTLEENLTPASVEFVTNLFAEELALDDRGHGDLFRARTFEAELICKDGSTVPVELKATALRDADGRPIGVLGVSRDITERKKAQEALSESQEELQAIFDNARDGIALFDLKGRLLKVNKRVLEVGGYTTDEVAGKTFDLLKMFTPESIERMFTVKDMISSGKEVPVFECEVFIKSGRKLNLEIHVSPFFLKGERLGIVSIMRDITERKKAEAALRESETRFRTVFEGTSLGIALVDFNGKTLGVNPAFEHMLGYNMEEFAEIASSLKYLHPEDSMVDADLYLEMVKGKREHYTVDKRYIRKDGEVIWGRQNLSIVRDASGKPKYFIAMIEDVTERKRMEEALRQSEERYRELIENANDILYTHDLAGNFTSINKVGEQVTGYRRDEVLAMNISSFLTPESLELARQMIARKVSDGGQTRYELEIVTKDGHKVLLEVNTRLIYEGDKPVAVQGIARDITERKKMEEALQKSEEKHRLYFESVSDVIFSIDPDFTVLSISPSVEKVLGYKCEELVGQKMWAVNVVAPEYLEPALSDAMRLFNGEHIISSECEFIAKDGTRKFGEISGAPIFSSDGKVVASISVARDITERRKMEEELRLLSDAVKMSKDSIVISDLEGRIIEANDATLKMHGIDNREDLIGRPALELISAEDHEMLTEKMATAVAEGGLPCILEYHCIKNDGSTFLCEATVSEVKDRKGEHTGYVAVSRDITERKLIEAALRQSEHNYRVLFEGTIDGMFVTDTETVTIVLANQTAAKMCGFDSAENTIGINPLDLVHPDDRERVLGFFMEDAPGKGEQEVHEFRVITKDGRKIWVSGMGTRIEYGGNLAVLSSIRDITERKRIDKALRQSEQSYRVLLESTHDSIIVVDAETFKITFGNRRASMMFGFDPVLQDAVGMNLLDFIHPEDREIAIKGFVEDLYQAERRRRYDVRAKTQDGRELWISALGTRIEFQGKIAVLLSLRDVTKDKQMEEEKRKLEDQIQLAGRLAAVGELAAGVAHELNNPITAIKGYAQLLTKKKELDEPLRKDLETIYRESQRAARITQNLLSFARRHEPEKHLISLNEAIQKTLELQAHPMKVNNIELVVELAPDLPKTLADFHQMQQVFVNIINNAEQAMIEAHGKGRLVIKTRKAGNVIQISFADNGPGISEENMQRIFDPFFTTKEVGKGTGLGLSICYGLVEAHGGRIYARSKLGQGATFVVEIPIVFEDQLVAEGALINAGSRGAKWKKPKGQY